MSEGDNDGQAETNVVVVELESLQFGLPLGLNSSIHLTFGLRHHAITPCHYTMPLQHAITDR